MKGDEPIWATAGVRRPTVARRLQLMALSLLLPAVVLMGLLLVGQYQDGRRRFEDQMLATARSLDAAADRELAHAGAALDALARSPALRAADFKTFDWEVREALTGRSGWIVLLSEDGRQLVNSRARPGEPLPLDRLSEEAWISLGQGRAHISGLVEAPLAGGLVVSVERPVNIGGRLYALAYRQSPEVYQALFSPGLLPDSWRGGVLDQSRRIVARNRDPGRAVGRAATEDMRKALARSDSGLVFSRSLEGERMLAAYARSPTSGWTVAIAVPRKELEWAATLSALAALILFTLLFVLGALFARMFARPISRDIAALADEAAGLGQQDRRLAASSELQETAQVRAALDAAAQALETREVERAAAATRQETLINELNHRVKNTLATVQSLAWHTFGPQRKTQTVQAFEQRLLALSGAHGLLTANAWTGAALEEVARTVLEPYGGRAVWRGPRAPLDAAAALGLSLVLHELATNAAKYGAFSSDEGRVELEWREAAGMLELNWREHGGPEVSPPARKGFGTRLILGTVERELGGRAVLDYAPEGLHCTIIAPLRGRAGAAARAAEAV